MLPELVEPLSAADEPMEAWIEISPAFQEAYAEPRNEDLIRRIYEFAFWCLEHGEQAPQAGRDLPTCVVVGFFEAIPTHQASREDMPRWFSRQEVLTMRDTFTHLYTGEFQTLLALWGEQEPSPRGDRERYRQYWCDTKKRADRRCT